MENENAFWHQRFESQLLWTVNTRDFIYRKLHFIDASSILELGCGTGALLSEIGTRFTKPRRDSGKNAMLAGIELDPKRAGHAKASMERQGIETDIQAGNARELPFHDGSFDIIASNYFLMWLDEDERIGVVREARRVLKKGGWFVIFAEPDYDGMIDYPDNGLRDALIRSLEQAGANTASGRHLHEDLVEFEKVHVQCCSQPWNARTLSRWFDEEWKFHEKALAGAFNGSEDLGRVKERERQQIKEGTKFTFIPVFFGFGSKP